MAALTFAETVRVQRWMPTLLAILLVLLCFTMALLSLSRPDYRRFPQAAAGLEAAFGRAGALEQEPVPLGNAVVTRAFFPEGEPVPLDAPWTGSGQLPPLDLPPIAAPAVQAGPPPELLATATSGADALVARARAAAAALAGRFTASIARGEVEIEARGRTTVLRLLERGAFAPGSARLEPAMRQQLADLGAALAPDPGLLTLRSHHTAARSSGASDWSLSAGRAAAVADALQSGSASLADRTTIVAYGATQLPADALARPARANRVEVVITQPLTPELRTALDTLRREAPQLALDLGTQLDPQTAEEP